MRMSERIESLHKILVGEADKYADLYIKFLRLKEQNAELLKALRRAEQTIRNLGHGNLTGDARLIALNESQNIKDAIAKAEGREL